MPSIPDRWLEYKPYGTPIKGTKILAFKVPLKQDLNNNLKPEQRFTTAALLEAFPRLKYIVDLTNTFRYYDKKEFTSVGVRYEKVMIPGREVPSMDVVKKFFKVMDDFISASGEDDLVGVHCTHGINRTGYLICRYLTQQLGWEVQECVKAFEEARGYPIERDIYLNALKQTPRGQKIDTSKINLTKPKVIPTIIRPERISCLSLRPDRPMGPPGLPGFPPRRRGFIRDDPFPPQHFGFGGPPPGFGPMPPPPPCMPPIPPPIPGPLYGPRPFRYGLQPGPAFPIPGFPPRMPGPPRPMGGPRLPPGPPLRLPLPKMPPPPPPVRSMPVVLKRLQTQKKKHHMRNGFGMLARNPHGIIRQDVSRRIPPKIFREQDFTVDTFEENLLTASHPQRRPTK